MRRIRTWTTIGLAVALTAATAAGAAEARPTAQPPIQTPQSEGGNPNVTYRDNAGHVHVVRFSTYAGDSVDVGDFDLTADAGGPKATGTPTGYGSAIDASHPEEHVDYRTASGHVIELWKRVSASSWHRTDLTLAAGTSARAKGDVVGWSHDTRGREWVAYRDTKGKLHALTWIASTKHWKDVNLSAAAHIKVKAMSDPTMFVDSISSVPRPVLVYRGSDKHVHILIWKVGAASTSWRDQDVSKSSKWLGASLSRPYGWASKLPATSRNELHVVFRTANGHVQELYGGFGHTWRHADLTSVSKEPVTAVGDIQGTVGTDELGQDYEAVQYKASDGMEHWLFYRAAWVPPDIDPPFNWNGHSLGYSIAREGLWLVNGGSAFSVFLSGGHLWSVERAWGPEQTVETDLTAVTGSATTPATSTGGYFTPALL